MERLTEFVSKSFDAESEQQKSDFNEKMQIISEVDRQSGHHTHHHHHHSTSHPTSTPAHPTSLEIGTASGTASAGAGSALLLAEKNEDMTTIDVVDDAELTPTKSMSTMSSPSDPNRRESFSGKFRYIH